MRKSCAVIVHLKGDIFLLTVKSFVKAFRTTLAKYFTLRFVKVFCKVHCKVVGKVLYNFRDI